MVKDYVPFIQGAVLGGIVGVVGSIGSFHRGIDMGEELIRERTQRFLDK